MEYSADNSEDSIPGEWDIVIESNDTVKELNRGVLSGTRAKRQVLRHEFVVTDRDDHGIVEVRTLVPKNSRLTIFTLKITRQL